MGLIKERETLTCDNIDIQHKDSKGWITLAQIKGDYSQYHYKYKDLKEAVKEWMVKDGTNLYISQNTFYKPQRRIENLKELKTLYIDIDCYNSQYTKDAVIYFIENDLYGTKIPRPNMLIDSGRGLYYVLLIESVPHMALPLWYAVQRYLYEHLKEYGGDIKALDPTRVLRVSGSINSKSNTQVEIIDYYDYKYTLREIQEEYLPEIPKKKEIKKGRPKKVVALFNEYSLYHARLLDLTKICELRSYDMEGYREITLFLYRYWTCCFTNDEEKALSDALELNALFKVPLTTREVERNTRSAEIAYKDKKYKYTNTKLIEILGITQEEQQHLKTIINNKEKYRRCSEEKKAKQKLKRRNENGLTKREQAKRDLIKEVQTLKQQGLKQREVVEKLDLGIATVKRYWNV